MDKNRSENVTNVEFCLKITKQKQLGGRETTGS